MMNLSYVQIYILGSLSTSFHLAGMKPLDMYCAKLSGGRYEYSSHVALQKYFRICRDVSAYFSCIYNRRAHVGDQGDFEVMSYERYFPNLDHLKQATYWFCLLDLYTIHRQFNYKNISCEIMINDLGCHERYENKTVMSQLEEAINSSTIDQDLVNKLSCSIVAPLTSCIQDQFLKCGKDFEIFKQYEMAKFGTDCLQSQRLASSYTHKKLCVGSATSLHQQTIQSCLVNFLLPVVVLVACMRGNR